MKNKLFAFLAAGMLSLSLVACDDILLPNDPYDPGNGGGQDTTWNPGDTTVDDDTTGGIDTSGTHDQIIITGTFKALDPADQTLPSGSKIHVLWHRADGVDFVHGYGEMISPTTWRVILDGPLPLQARWGAPNGDFSFAVGTVSLVDGAVPPTGTIETGVFGITEGFDIIYDTNTPTDDVWGKTFLHRFPKGYMVGAYDFDNAGELPGYKPSKPSGLPLMFVPWP